MREQAKGSILFGLFVGAVGQLALLPLSGELGRWLGKAKLMGKNIAVGFL